MPSKYPSANGSSCASASIGSTVSAQPAAWIRAQFSVGLTHRSAATTRTPYSRARKTEVSAVPQPRSSTRAPGGRSRAGQSHSNSHNGCGPIALSITWRGSYPALRGYRGRVNRAARSSTMPASVPPARARSDRITRAERPDNAGGAAGQRGRHNEGGPARCRPSNVGNYVQQAPLSVQTPWLLLPGVSPWVHHLAVHLWPVYITDWPPLYGVLELHGNRPAQLPVPPPPPPHGPLSVQTPEVLLLGASPWVHHLAVHW